MLSSHVAAGRLFSISHKQASKVFLLLVSEPLDRGSRSGGVVWFPTRFSGSGPCSRVTTPLRRPITTTARTTGTIAKLASTSTTSTTSLSTTTINHERFYYYHTSTIANQPVRRRRKFPVSPSATSETDQDDDDDNDDDDDKSRSERDNARRRAVARRRTILRETNARAFAQVSQQLLDTIYAALEKLRAINDPYFLSRDTEPDLGEYILLDLGPLRGQYTLQVDLEQALVQMQSPNSGIIQYYYDLDDLQWRSLDDGHILQGLLVRDLIRQIQGVPQL